jgi:hypothetical protein
MSHSCKVEAPIVAQMHKLKTGLESRESMKITDVGLCFRWVLLDDDGPQV